MSDADTKSSTGDTKSNTGDTKSSTGDTKSSTGDTKSSTGDTKSNTGDTKSSTGDTKSSTGDTKSSIGDTKSSTGDTKSSTGDTKSSIGDTKSSIGDTKSSTGDTKSSIGDTKSSTGDTKSSIGDTKSSIGDTKSSIGDTKSSIGDTKSSTGDTKSSTGDTKSSIGDTKSSIGDTKSSTGDTKSSTGDTKSNTGDTKSNTGDTKSSTGDTQSSTGDTKSNTGDTKSNTGDTKSNTGDTKSSTGDTKSNTGDTKSNTGDTKSNTGDTKSNTGDTKSNTGDTKSNTGDTKPRTGDTKSSIGDTKSRTGDTKPRTGDTKSSIGDTKSNTGDTKSSIGDTNSSTGDSMVDIVRHLYPGALTRTYIVPPVHYNWVPYNTAKVPGTDREVFVLPSSEQLQKPQGNIQADLAQQHVLHNLQKLGDSGNEVMFVVSELNFKDYLNQPTFAKLTGKLPKPANLPKEHRHHGKQGDFDILVIHRKHGILVGEMKSVGKNEASRADAEVVKVIDKAVKQLDKCEKHARHMVSDIAPGLTVRKTFFLPYVSCAQLQRILDDKCNSKLREAVCLCLGTANAAEAVQLCCCSDQLSQPASYWDVTEAVLSQLSTWWQHRMACTVDTLLTDDNYLDIVARFVGPATTVSVPCYNGVRVEVRTAGQAVAELGRRLALLVLTLQQLDLLNRNPQLVCLTGPPGTGKTVVLVLQGLRWLLQGHDVQVVSTRYLSRAASRMVAEQLGMALSADPTPPSTPGSAVVLDQYDFANREADVQRAVTDLLARVKDGQLHVLLDEADFAGSTVSGPRHTTLVARLAKSVPGLHLWAAGVLHTNIPPSLRPEPLTVPLRCAPSVLREVQTAVNRATGEVHNYSDSGVPAPGDGLRVIRLSHHGNAHTGRWPAECQQCGKEVAAELLRLGVGSGGSSLPNSPTPLSYRDVFIITRSSELQDDIEDDAGRVTSRASGVVRGLRDEGLPVCVLGVQDFRHNTARWERDVHDVAVAATDRVTVTRYGWVHGLERRVVVMLPGRDKERDEGLSDEVIDLVDRLFAASRCSTQLIMVDVPPVTTATSTAT